MQIYDTNKKACLYQSLWVIIDFRKGEKKGRKTAEQEYTKSLKPHRGNNLKDFKGCFHKPFGTQM